MKQFFISIIVRRWWWCPLCSRPTRLLGFL